MENNGIIDNTVDSHTKFLNDIFNEK
jgi:hypothetical protein